MDAQVLPPQQSQPSRKRADFFIVFAHVLFAIGSQGQNYLLNILSAPIWS